MKGGAADAQGAGASGLQPAVARTALLRVVRRASAARQGQKARMPPLPEPAAALFSANEVLSPLHHHPQSRSAQVSIGVGSS